MSNEYPPINVSDEWKNQLRKAIDQFWEVQYKTFSKGRIKRMRTRRKCQYIRIDKRLRKKVYDLRFIDFSTNITRWNKH